MKLTKMDDGRWLLEFSGGATVLTAFQIDELTEQLGAGAPTRAALGAARADRDLYVTAFSEAEEQIARLRAELDEAAKKDGWLSATCKQQVEDIKRVRRTLDLVEREHALGIAQVKQLRSTNEALVEQVNALVREVIAQQLPTVDELVEQFLRFWQKLDFPVGADLFAAAELAARNSLDAVAAAQAAKAKAA